jgi:hypothetical protein
VEADTEAVNVLKSPDIKLLREKLGEPGTGHCGSDSTPHANEPRMLKTKLGTPGADLAKGGIGIGEDQVDSIMLAQVPLPASMEQSDAGTAQKYDREQPEEKTPATVTEKQEDQKVNKKSLPVSTSRITRSSAKKLEFEESDVPKLSVSKPEPSETTSRAARCTTPLQEPKFGRCSVCADQSKASGHGPAHKKRKG